MRIAVSDTIALLQRTPQALASLLWGLPDVWRRHNEGGESWSAHGVIGRLIHAERKWTGRLHRVLEFARMRPLNVSELRALGLKPADLNRRGLHPSLGPVTLENLLASWVAHDLTHLHQVSRLMAHQVREHAGPWEKNLGVLHCKGHGAT
ncbi:MAG: DinB family protein [Terriglobales bacterium]